MIHFQGWQGINIRFSNLVSIKPFHTNRLHMISAQNARIQDTKKFTTISLKIIYKQ